MVEAGTCEPEGYTAEKAKGNIKTIPAGGTFRADFRIGALSPDEAQTMATVVEKVIAEV